MLLSWRISKKLQVAFTPVQKKYNSLHVRSALNNLWTVQLWCFNSRGPEWKLIASKTRPRKYQGARNSFSRALTHSLMRNINLSLLYKLLLPLIKTLLGTSWSWRVIYNIYCIELLGNCATEHIWNLICGSACDQPLWKLVNATAEIWPISQLIASDHIELSKAFEAPFWLCVCLGIALNHCAGNPLRCHLFFSRVDYQLSIWLEKISFHHQKIVE